MLPFQGKDCPCGKKIVTAASRCRLFLGNFHVETGNFHVEVDSSQAADNHNGNQSACAPHYSLFTINDSLILLPFQGKDCPCGTLCLFANLIRANKNVRELLQKTP
jgi:hypothetical protein